MSGRSGSGPFAHAAKLPIKDAQNSPAHRSLPQLPFVSVLFQIRLPAKLLPCRMCTQMLPLATSPAVMLSMSSWVSVWPGPWPPSTGPCRDRSSTCPPALWPSRSLFSPSLHLSASVCSCTAGGPTWAGSSEVLMAASLPQHGSL